MTKRYSPITPDQMAKFRTQLASAGITAPSGNSGQSADPKDGVTLGFVYDGTANLDLTIITKPWYIPASLIWNELDGYVN
jgi:hypothetical protein